MNENLDYESMDFEQQGVDRRAMAQEAFEAMRRKLNSVRHADLGMSPIPILIYSNKEV